MQHMDEAQVASGAKNEGSSPARQSKGRAISKSVKVEISITLVLLVVAIFVYLFVAPAKVTNASRISHLEAIVKCPTCISVSTADANTASAIALRSYITQMVNSGASDQEVIAQLEATYGKSVLLVPPNGFGLLLAVGTVGLAVIVPFGFIVLRVAKRRRSDRGTDNSQLDDAISDAESDVQDFAEAQSEQYLDDSKVDAGAPSVSGLNSHGELVGVGSGKSPLDGSNFTAASSPSRFSLRNLSAGQRIVGVVGSLFVIAGVTLLAITLLSGTSGSSNNQLTPTQISTLISNGQTLSSFGQDKSALSAFSKVLISDPNQPVALAWNGWILTKSGVTSKSKSLIEAGTSQLRQSIAIDPSYLYSRLFYGLVLANDLGDPVAATTQFDKFLSLNPPASLLATIKSELVTVYKAANLAVPSNLGS